MKKGKAICFLIISLLCTLVISQDITNFYSPKVEEFKNKLAMKNSTVERSYQKLISRADKALYEGPFSVTSKTVIPPSGDKHDYLSLAPYFWPDPNKIDGLPWIRKDGQVNPGTRGNNVDYDVKNQFFRNVSTLAWAGYFSEDKKYAKKAVELLEVWFFNESTRMNPNLNYAQGIPGLNEGRCFGIIEFGGINKVITAIELLEKKNALTAKKGEQLRKWFSDYLYWLQTSEFGIEEKTRSNNHATHYDVQVIGLLLFLNRKAEAKKVLESVKTERISTQIEPDGSQPHELARTKGLSYSTMNLKGFTELAYYGKKNGVDLWNYIAENGASIQRAYSFLAPYAYGEKEWNYQQINKLDDAQKNLKKLFRFATCTFGSIDNLDSNLFKCADEDFDELFL